MLTADGHMKVMDFGLAKQLATPEIGATSEQDITESASRTGMGLGTPAYMSPEQLRRRQVDTRSDIFSFGIVLYEMLTGKHPFTKPDLVDTVSSILNEDPPPLSTYLGTVTPLLQHMVRKMLSKDIERRYQLIHEVVTDLRAVMAEISGSTRAVKDSTAASPARTTVPLAKRSWQQIVAVALVALAAGILLTFMADSLFRSPPAPRPPFRVGWPLPSDQSLGQLWGRQLDVSPDGTRLVYAANHQVYMRRLDGLQAKPIAEIGGLARAPFFSSDSQWVVYEEYSGGKALGTTLTKLPVSGGEPVTLCTTRLLFGASWAAGDRIVLGEGPEGIFQIPAAGGKKELVVSLASGEEAYHPQVLPGGEAILFTLLTDFAPLTAPMSRQWDEAQIVWQSLETSERRVLIDGATDARYVRTGHLVYVREGTLLAQAFDLSRLQLTGDPVTVVEGVLWSRRTGTGQFAFSDTGLLLYASGRPPVPVRRTIVSVDREGREQLLALEPGPYLDPKVSPDGSRLAIVVEESPENTDAWSYDLHRKTMTRLTLDPAMDASPVWTPDGERFVFTSRRGGRGRDLYRKRADGAGSVERLTWNSNPKGGLVLFSRREDAGLLRGSWNERRPVDPFPGRGSYAEAPDPNAVSGIRSGHLAGRTLDCLCFQRIRELSGLRSTFPGCERR